MRAPAPGPRLALGVAAGAILVTAIVGVFVHSPRRPRAVWPAAWDPRVTDIVRFVEAHRGLTFDHPVAVRFLADRQFDQKVAVPKPQTAADRAALARVLGELRALGLVHGNVDINAAANSLTQSEVIGLYVYSDRTVYVRGSDVTPYVRVTLAHELTHALQDQHFDLRQLESRVANGDDTALTSLIEGDAVRVENAYQRAMSPPDQASYDRQQAAIRARAGSTRAVPEVLTDVLSFPYAFGPTFVDTLAAGGGNARVDAAFRRPPVAEAQIVDPVGYPPGWRPAAVAPPRLPAGDRRADSPQPFGQVSLFEVLGARLGYAPAWAAVQGWRGDNSVPYTDHGRTCVAADVRFDGAAHASSFADAARRWATSIPGATVGLAGTDARIRSCDPGATAPPPPAVTPSAFEVLAVRAQLIDGLVTDANVGFTLGACVADHVIAAIGPAQIAGLAHSSAPTPAQQQSLRDVFIAGARACRGAGSA